MRDQSQNRKYVQTLRVLGWGAGARNYIGLNTKARAARVEGEPISRLAVCTHGRCHVWLLVCARAQICMQARTDLYAHERVCVNRA